MANSITHPFSGIAGETCSVVGKTVAEKAKELGLTEAEYEKHVVKGEWGSVKGRIKKGTLKDGPFASYEDDGKRFLLGWQKETGYYRQAVGSAQQTNISVKQVEWTLNHPAAKNIRFGSGKRPPAVSPTSKSVGKMTDEDAANLFVQTRDEIAEAKGYTSVKGAPKAIDAEVYNSLSKLTGYTPVELTAKVERYKASGKKLSALKKKQLKSGKKYDPTQYAKKDTVAKAADDAGKKLDDIVAKTKTKDDDVIEMGGNVAEKGTDYTEQQIAEAYIKAKDFVAARPDNSWTLYTKSSKFEDAIRAEMKFNGVDLTRDQIERVLTEYVTKHKKLSVLKKQMVQQGKLKPKAPSLKSGKAKKFPDLDPLPPPSTSSKQINDLLGSYGTPGYKPKTFAKQDADSLILSADNIGLYLHSPEEKIWGWVLDEMAKPYAKGAKPIDILRTMDEMRAAKAGVQNVFPYEKKIVQWLGSPEGKAYLKNKADKDRLWASQPELPKDSDLFQNISPQRASSIQKKQPRWTPEQREAIRDYTASDYISINNTLRQGGKSRKADIISSGMEPLPEPMLLHRGVSFDALGIDNLDDAVDLVGKSLHEKGFSSTSVGEQAAFSMHNVQLVIQVPRGTRGMYVNHVSFHKAEKELILDKDTTFKVLRVERMGALKARVYVRVVKQGGN